jgi:hypothetical protein
MQQKGLQHGQVYIIGCREVAAERSNYAGQILPSKCPAYASGSDEQMDLYTAAIAMQIGCACITASDRHHKYFQFPLGL